ncbi:DNA-binding transcriptional regulator, GntR family [Paramicrobacterium humi]|uniref:DNA-binding transcriptional regulator, GntR family n=1 Tax=Paramicrobacterium humi TaxID=640635 RepID=A0A1H4JT56_9MICO|nr:GntR family transcriptional regulator [Microbacterium humi]SEB48968.1 DNA-binding transcriptional regulator, GntR family [Microbacterium humi]
MANASDAASASERAYQTIRDAILDGTHEPGTMLGEAPLAASLGVSRTPVRVALARLQDEGWIVVYPKRGALVQGLSERTIAELADARFILETTGVDRASDAVRQRLADRLDASLDEQRAALANDDTRLFIDLTRAFHRSFVEASDNSVLLELYERLSDRHRFVLFASGDRLRARATEIIREHERLIAHVRTGSVEAFSTALRDHIAEVPSEVNPRPTGGLRTAAVSPE